MKDFYDSDFLRSNEATEFVDKLFRDYIQYDIPIARDQASFINDYRLEQRNEIERLHSIIKEVREYIEKEQKHQMIWGTITLGKESQKELLEILDKAGDEK